MSKIGRKPIDIGSVQIEIKGQQILYKGKNGSGSYELPEMLTAHLDGKFLKISAQKAAEKSEREINRTWGLNRALVANKIKGVDIGFEKELQIVGLGYKAVLSGNNVVLSLGYSHKIDFPLPKGISLEIDKTGQRLVFKGADKELLGHVCSLIRSLRPPEPYKGTGVKLSTEVIARKAGKTKAAAA